MRIIAAVGANNRLLNGLNVGAINSTPVSGVTSVSVSPSWIFHGSGSLTATPDADPISIQWWEGDPATGGSIISGATSLSYSPPTTFACIDVVCIIDGVKSNPVTVAGIFNGTLAASAATGTLPTSIVKRRGQTYVVASQTEGGQFTSNGTTTFYPQIGGIEMSPIVTATHYGSSRYAAMFGVANDSIAADPTFAWTDPGSLTNIGMGLFQMVGFDLTPIETPTPTIDTNNANTAVVCAFSNRHYLTYSFGNRLGQVSGATSLQAAPNTCEHGFNFEPTLTTALNHSHTRTTGTIANRTVIGARFSPIGAPTNYTPALNFSIAANSQYLALLEDI